MYCRLPIADFRGAAQLAIGTRQFKRGEVFFSRRLFFLTVENNR